ncbi:hypothetical protein CSX00_12325 [Pseudobutyrivibrio ruminis]|uniref:Uncharacterized protein n=1 Tax=Pseudobutyrivibrio ruminis TaxID=46206 RepID=A0A2G3E797_9FIRM|nr:hypothetical protein [Pseudobutyrivibrio ruminis]PHU39104.1 hypothetical protein CSX00_12325 [Pseudobutyrivibrio ruminis]
MLKKYLKRITSFIFATFFAISRLMITTVHAEENQGDFIPFRSDYVAYIAQNASADSDIVQWVWLKLFDEETNWNSSQSYYSATATDPSGNTVSASKWATKYYNLYVGTDGALKSSYNTQVTYNPEFDGFIFATLINNDDFVINWLNQEPGVFKQYAQTSSSHPIFTEGMIELTKNGLFLGGGKDASNNTFLKGAGSTNTKYNAKWSAGGTTRDTYDISVLKIFGSDYMSLSDIQKTWVKTYMEWMVSDYVEYRTGGVAAKNNSESLYNLISTSYEGFANGNVNQEFFNYCISSPDVAVGDLIVNAAEKMGETSAYRTGKADVAANINMSSIWAGDADCDYTETSLGDNDYDWLAYNICFSNSSFYSTLRTLVDNNTVTAQQKQEWLMRYYQKHSTSSSEGSMSYAIQHAGETITSDVKYASSTWTGCGRSCWSDDDDSFWCPIHSGEGYQDVVKPIGVKSFSFELKPGGGGFGNGHVASSLNVTVKDTDSGTVIYDNIELQNKATLSIPDKYVWSSTIVISISAHYKDGLNQHVGRGACDRYHNGYCNATWTYVPLSDCEKNRHIYSYSYQFYDKYDNPITSGSSTTPYYCKATGYCTKCPATDVQYDYTLRQVNTTSKMDYVADFEHSSEIGEKTYTVYKGSAATSFKEYSSTKNTGYTTGSCSGSSSSGKYAASSSKTVIENGSGNSFGLHASASGTFSLKSGSIMDGAKTITVSASAKEVTFKLYSPKRGCLDEIALYSSSSSELTWTFDCSDYSDTQLEGAYISVNMHSTAQNTGGRAVGESASVNATVRFNYIKVTY